MDIRDSQPIDEAVLHATLVELAEHLRHQAISDGSARPFYPTLSEMKELLTKKGDDYSGNRHQWMSFVIEAMMTNLSVDTIFMASFARKLSRLISLYDNGNSPNFESVEDSWKDLLGYLILFVSYQRWAKVQNASSDNPSEETR